MSAISSACSPVSGWLISSSSTFTPIAAAYTGSIACSASMYAHTPPLRCASATTCVASVDLPDDSGPKISTIRPRGRPPMPSARSSASAPVGIASTPTWPRSPNFMIEPLPNCLSIWLSAISRALSRSTVEPLSLPCGVVIVESL